jgi:hypothetical protein
METLLTVLIIGLVLLLAAAKVSRGPAVVVLDRVAVAPMGEGAFVAAALRGLASRFQPACDLI